MQFNLLLKTLSLSAFTLFSASIFAADPEIYSHKTKGAIDGTDVVAYFSLAPGAKAVAGSSEFSYQWKGATWKFSSAANRQKFIDNPEQYAPQYGGYCAFATGSGKKGFTTSIRPNSWTIFDNKLYLNHNKASYKLFNKRPEQRISKADSHWPEVLTVCEKNGDCRK